MKMNQSMSYMRYLNLVVLMLVSFVSFGQAPSNYTNINGRYRWIAGMFDSTFHIPKGTTPSLRTGGSTNGGALFFKTADSSLQVYTGSQWLRMLKVGDTTGMLLPYFNSVGVGLKSTGQTVYADTLLLSTRLWRNKGIDSVQANLTAGLALKVNISDTASMLSPYLRSNVAAATYVPLTRTITINGTSQDLSANRTYNVGTVTSVATSTGTGITGGTITGSGTLAIDTLLISTRAWRQKGIDSVVALIPSLTGYVPYTGATANVDLGVYDLTADVITGSTGSFSSSGSGNTFGITHSSGSGIALNITKGGNGEGLYVNKTSGSGNAATIVGTLEATTLVKTGGTSSQYLMADGTTSTLTNPVTGTGTTNYIPKFTSSSAIGNSIMSEGSSVIDIAGSLRLSGTGYLGFGGGTNYIEGDNPNNILKFATNNSERLRISSTGNVGIGTSTIYGKVNINSNGAPASTGTMSTGLTISNGTAGTAINIGTNDGGGYNYIQSSYVNNANVGLPLTFFTGATERMRLDASGNLGLGTSSPSGQSSDNRVLHIVGAGTGTRAQLKLTNATSGNTGTDGLMISFDDQLDAYLYNFENGKLIFGTNNAVRATLDASGNLGLGVTPSAWISTSKAFQLGNTAALFNPTSEAILSNNMFVNSADANIYLTTNFATQYRQVNGQHIWYNAASGTAGNAISFTQAMTLFSTGNLAVGGTTDAGYKLDVNGTGRFSGQLSVSHSTASNYAAVIYNTSATGEGLTVRGGSTSSHNAFIVQPYNGAVSLFNVLATGAATFSSSVKINGTPAATSGILSVVTSTSTLGATADLGLLISNGGSLGQMAQIGFGYSESRSAAVIGGIISNGGGATTSDLFFATRSTTTGSDAPTERMRITSGGNVGIGTSSPTSLFVVSKSSNSGSGSTFPRMQVENTLATQGDGSSTFNFADIRIASGNGAVEMYLASSYASGTWEPQGLINVATNHPMIFRTNNAERMRITSGGYLLLGTTTSAYGQAGRGTFEMEGSTENILAQKVSGSLANYIYSNSSYTELYSTNDLRFSVNSSERMRLTNSGELLINTTSDAGDYKLQVNGNSYLNGVTKLTKSVEFAHSTKSATYTLTSDDYTIGFDCAANRTANLPDAATCAGRVYVIYQYNTSGGIYGVTLDGNASQTINGNTTYTLAGYCDYTSVMIQSDGSNWVIISDSIQTGCL